MSLPLEERATVDGVLYLLTPRPDSAPPPQPDGETRAATVAATSLIPLEALQPGEQYRFHFDMTRCIGCRCCEVACSEQNNNPVGIQWRRVGEIEGGSYPFTQRLHVSMGCNHCLEPSCMTGCPVDAYTKDPATGLVLHSADACIGCQYCTWNCPYGVPQFNPDRGIVGKCDMCHGRLTHGQTPACVSACPEEAIRIEKVNVAEWRQQVEESGNAPGLPPAGQTVSTTRITLPPSLPTEFERGDARRVMPEHPHWPLVFMTVMTQIAVGGLTAIWLNLMRRNPAGASAAGAATAALTALGTAIVALLCSTLHLGRPIHAARALRMWKRSWLSREVLLFTLFSASASVFAGLLLTRPSLAGPAGGLTALTGWAAVSASAALYLVPARPAWNSGHTVADFALTAALGGPLLLAVCLHSSTLAAGSLRLWLVLAAAAASLQLLNQTFKLFRLARSNEFERLHSAQLLMGPLASRWIARMALLAAIPVLLFAAPHDWGVPAALLAAAASELLGRYLFFVSVVPRNIAASFLGRRGAA